MTVKVAFDTQELLMDLRCGADRAGSAGRARRGRIAVRHECVSLRVDEISEPAKYVIEPANRGATLLDRGTMPRFQYAAMHNASRRLTCVRTGTHAQAAIDVAILLPLCLAIGHACRLRRSGPDTSRALATMPIGGDRVVAASTAWAGVRWWRRLTCQVSGGRADDQLGGQDDRLGFSPRVR